MKRLPPILLTLLLPLLAPAADIADLDRAHHAAYQDGWQPGDDGSSQPGWFGGWVMEEAASKTKIAIESSAGLGTGKTDVDRNGAAFKVYDPSGGYVDLYRFIDPLGLEAGETLSLDLAVNFRSGFKGMDARDADENALFNFNVGDEEYTVSKVSTGNGSVGSAYAAHTVFNLRFQQESEVGGTWTVTRSGDLAGTATGTYTGRIRSLKFYSGGHEGCPEDALYFNNLTLHSAPAALP